MPVAMIARRSCGAVPLAMSRRTSRFTICPAPASRVASGTTISLSVVNTFEDDAADAAADAGDSTGGDLGDTGGPAWTLPMLATGLAAHPVFVEVTPTPR